MTKQEKLRVYKKEYRRINKAKIDAYNKTYHEKNAESCNARYIEAKETMTEAQKETQRLQRAAASRKHYAAHRDQLAKKRRSIRAAAKSVQTDC
jgi:hypothetical protein